MTKQEKHAMLTKHHSLIKKMFLLGILPVLTLSLIFNLYPEWKDKGLIIFLIPFIIGFFYFIQGMIITIKINLNYYRERKYKKDINK